MNKNYYETLLRHLDEQRCQLESHLSQSSDEELRRTKQKSINEYFDAVRHEIAPQIIVSIEAETASFVYGDDVFEYYASDSDDWDYVKELAEDGRMPSAQDLSDLFGMDNLYFRRAMGAGSNKLMQKYGLKNGTECLAAIGLTENDNAFKLMRFVNSAKFDHELKSVKSFTIPFLDASPVEQEKNLSRAIASALSASECLNTIYRFKLYEMGYRIDYFSRLRKSMISKNMIQWQAETTAKELAKLEQKVAKETLSESATNAANARHSRTNKFKEMAIEKYESRTFQSQADAARRIAAYLREWASENHVHPLSPMSEIQTVTKWIREYRKDKTKREAVRA